MKKQNEKLKKHKSNNFPTAKEFYLVSSTKAGMRERRERNAHDATGIICSWAPGRLNSP